MDEPWRSIVQLIGILIAWVILVILWTWIRRLYRRFFGIGAFVRRLPETEEYDLPGLIKNMEALGNFLMDRSVREDDVTGTVIDWQWRVGSDIKSLVGYARSYSSLADLTFGGPPDNSPDQT